jgi:hypothetical protein
VAGTDHDDVRVEKFAPNGGTVIVVLGGLAVAGFIAGWALDPDAVPLWVPGLAAFCGVVLYASTVRPRVLVRGHDLVLRNMLSTVSVPLAAVEELAVRQVLAVRAGDKRYVCAGVGRSLRQALKGSAMQRAREEMGGLRGEIAAVREPGMSYADYVEIRLQELVNEDRSRRGIAKFSDEADELAKLARRTPAWPEIAALVVTAVFVVVAIIAG